MVVTLRAGRSSRAGPVGSPKRSDPEFNLEASRARPNRSSESETRRSFPAGWQRERDRMPAPQFPLDIVSLPSPYPSVFRTQQPWG